MFLAGFKKMHFLGFLQKSRLRRAFSGKNYHNARSFLERRYNEELELDDAVHTAILTLKESFEGQMNEHNIEIGICDSNGFKRLDPSEVKDYLGSLA